MHKTQSLDSKPIFRSRSVMQIQRNVLRKNDKIMISRRVASIDFFKAKGLQYFWIRFCCVSLFICLLLLKHVTLY